MWEFLLRNINVFFLSAMCLFSIWLLFLIRSIRLENEEEKRKARAKGCNCDWKWWGPKCTMFCPLPEHSMRIKYECFNYSLGQPVEVLGYPWRGTVERQMPTDRHGVMYDVLFYDVPLREANILTRDDAMHLLGDRAYIYFAMGHKPSMVTTVREEDLHPVGEPIVPDVTSFLLQKAENM